MNRRPMRTIAATTQTPATPINVLRRLSFYGYRERWTNWYLATSQPGAT